MWGNIFRIIPIHRRLHFIVWSPLSRTSYQNMFKLVPHIWRTITCNRLLLLFESTLHAGIFKLCFRCVNAYLQFIQRNVFGIFQEKRIDKWSKNIYPVFKIFRFILRKYSLSMSWIWKCFLNKIWTSVRFLVHIFYWKHDILKKMYWIKFKYEFFYFFFFHILGLFRLTYL